MAWTNRWLVLVASMWLQACSGIGYVFGSLSPVIKLSLDYNQKQINRLGVAKDIGDSVGLLSGLLCDWLPSWGIILVGLLQNLVGYGWLWLIVIKRVPQPHFALVTYFLPPSFSSVSLSLVSQTPVMPQLSLQGGSESVVAGEWVMYRLWSLMDAIRGRDRCLC